MKKKGNVILIVILIVAVVVVSVLLTQCMQKNKYFTVEYQGEAFPLNKPIDLDLNKAYTFDVKSSGGVGYQVIPIVNFECAFSVGNFAFSLSDLKLSDIVTVSYDSDKIIIVARHTIAGYIRYKYPNVDDLTQLDNYASYLALKIITTDGQTLIQPLRIMAQTSGVSLPTGNIAF